MRKTATLAYFRCVCARKISIIVYTLTKHLSFIISSIALFASLLRALAQWYKLEQQTEQPFWVKVLDRESSTTSTVKRGKVPCRDAFKWVFEIRKEIDERDKKEKEQTQSEKGDDEDENLYIIWYALSRYTCRLIWIFERCHHFHFRQIVFLSALVVTPSFRWIFLSRFSMLRVFSFPRSYCSLTVTQFIGILVIRNL